MYFHLDPSHCFHHCWRRVKRHFHTLSDLESLLRENVVLHKLVGRVNLETIFTNNLENMLYLFGLFYFHRSPVPER